MARIIAAFEQFLDDAGNPLVNGHLQFLESGTNNTDKTTYKDVNLIIPNTNPVRLNGAGKPSYDIFGTGVYKVILFADDGLGNPGTQMEVKDPVGGSSVGQQWGEWQPGLIYDKEFIVTGSDSQNYRSIVDGNKGSDPALNASPEKWEQIKLGREWNNFVVYAIGDSAFCLDQ